MFGERFLPIDTSIYEREDLSSLSFEAATLYTFLLSKTALDRLKDSQGRRYTHFTMEDVQKLCRCGNTRAARIFHELDDIHGIGVVHVQKLSDGHTRVYVS